MSGRVVRLARAVAQSARHPSAPKPVVLQIVAVPILRRLSAQRLRKPSLPTAIRPGSTATARPAILSREGQARKGEQVYRFCALILVASLVFAACGGGSEDAEPSGGSVSGDDIRTTLEGVLNAALNGDADGFSAYLASSCEDKEDLAQGVGLLRSLLGGLVPEGEISVRLSEVEY